MKYLIHVDGKLPNLALMRLGAYFRNLGEEVRLVRHRAVQPPGLFEKKGEVYASSIFLFSEARRRAYNDLWSCWGPIVWGGTGVRLQSSLSEVDNTTDWEAWPPDYSLYPDEDRSIGFTQRGCRLKCKFCVVPEKEGRARAIGTISDIWRGPGHPKKILLLDNDFFGQDEESWRSRCDELREGGFRVCFTQGINIRQVDEPVAEALASLEYRGNDFQRRVLYTAWDSLGDEERFKKGVALLAKAGVKPEHLRVYMLIGYAPGEQMEDILYRFHELVKLGCEPYPMAYDQGRPELKAFQRWAIRGLYHHVPWKDYHDPRLGTKAPRPAPLPVLKGDPEC